MPFRILDMRSHAITTPIVSAIEAKGNFHYTGEVSMTEWNAAEYARLSGLQRAMAEEVLALLPLHDGESILDVGCGNGKITAEPPEKYAALAEMHGLRVCGVHTADHAWDFGSREAFAAFGAVTFVAWTEHIPEAERPAFVDDVLDRYRQVASEAPGEDNTFKFYQMDVTAVRA